MLNSAEHGICRPANKCQVTHNYKFFLAKHEYDIFSSDKYVNANNCWHFLYLLANLSIQ